MSAFGLKRTSNNGYSSISIYEYTPSISICSRRDRLQPAPGRRRPECADHHEHHQHGASDEAEYAGGAVAAEEERDDEAGEDGAEPAPRIDEAHRAGANAGRIEFRLIGVERERHPIVAQRDQHAEDDDARGRGLPREQQPEHRDAERRP